jgi:hypothetical protein
LEGILQHHYIPGITPSGLLEDDFARFLDFRADQLVMAFRVRTGIGSASEELFSSDPAKPISLLETRMRNFLHETLRGGASESYWKECIPPDIQEAVNRKLGEEMKRHPYGRTEFDRDEVRMQFLDVMDYCGFRSSRSRSRRKAIAVTVEADHPVGPTRSGRSDAGLLLV